MWVVHRVLRAGYMVLNRAGVLQSPAGRRSYEWLYERFKLATESAAIDRLCEAIRPGSLVIDVGANIGIYTQRFAARTRAGGRVLALEPDPANADSLRRRFRDDSAVAVVQAAASDVAGTVFLAQDRDNPAGHALSDRGLEVRSVRIDDLVRESGLPLSAMKIDVEGAEPLVLKGAVEAIREHRPAILLEYSPERIGNFGVEPMSVLAQFEALGYRFKIPPKTAPLTAGQVHEASRAKGYVDVLISA